MPDEHFLRRSPVDLPGTAEVEDRSGASARVHVPSAEVAVEVADCGADSGAGSTLPPLVEGMAQGDVKCASEARARSAGWTGTMTDFWTADGRRGWIERVWLDNSRAARFMYQPASGTPTTLAEVAAADRTAYTRAFRTLLGALGYARVRAPEA